MIRRTAAAVFVLLPWLSAPVLDAAQAAGPEAPVSFTRDIAPMLRALCARCHMTGDEPGGIALYPAVAYRNLVGVPSQAGPLLRVKPGDIEASYLMLKLEGKAQTAEGDEGQMPLDTISPGGLELIRRWIVQGAADD